MKATIEQSPEASKTPGILPALYRNTITGSVWLIDHAPLPRAGDAPGPAFRGVHLSQGGNALIVGGAPKLGSILPVLTFEHFEKFTGRLILENDK